MLDNLHGESAHKQFFDPSFCLGVELKARIILFRFIFVMFQSKLFSKPPSVAYPTVIGAGPTSRLFSPGRTPVGSHPRSGRSFVVQGSKISRQGGLFPDRSPGQPCVCLEPDRTRPPGVRRFCTANTRVASSNSSVQT